MSQSIVRLEDFKNPPGIHQIQGMIYRGEGSPIGQKSSPNLGAIYIDYISGNIWSCTTINSVNGWLPFYSQSGVGITIDTDVQEGDFIGIYGAGTWANSSATINTARDSCASSGSEFSAWLAGGKTAAAALSSTETFNGVSWAMSANSLLTAPVIPGTGELYDLIGGGSQTAAWTIGGHTWAGGTGTAYTFMQIFNGDTWTLGANSSFSAGTAYGAGNGTLFSAWHMEGAESGSAVSSVAHAEYYNGYSWVKYNSTVLLTFLYGGNKGIGSSNSNFVCGGTSSRSGGSGLSTTVFYNGNVYYYGPNINIARREHQLSGTTLNSIMSGGASGISFYTTSEFFNGSTWGTGNNLSISARAKGANGGDRNIAMIAAGTSNGTTKLNSTEFHTQSIYRKLNYTSAMGAIDIGIAFDTNNSSYTASIMSGDIISHRTPYSKFFSLNRFIHYPSKYYLETARNISSVTANGDGTATIILASSNTEITKGMLFFVSGSSTSVNNGTFPVVNFSGGSSVTVKNPNAINQGASGTAALLWGNRIIGLPTTAITYTAPNVIFTFDLTGTITAATLSKLISVNSILYVPFSSTSGTTGSQYNYGTYVVKSISSNTITCSFIHSQHATETINCTSVEILNHIIAKDFSESEDFVLGYNNRMNLITNTSNDANYEKW